MNETKAPPPPPPPDIASETGGGEQGGSLEALAEEVLLSAGFLHDVERLLELPVLINTKRSVTRGW